MEKKDTQLKFKIIDNTKLLYIGFISDNKGNGFCKILRDEVESKEEAIERAEFIVEACNNFERLQSENERMRKLLKEIMEGKEWYMNYQEEQDFEYTPEEKAERAKNDDFISQIQTLLNPK